MYVSQEVSLAGVGPIDEVGWLSVFISKGILVGLDARRVLRAAVAVLPVLVAWKQHSEGVAHPHFAVERLGRMVLARVQRPIFHGVSCRGRSRVVFSLVQSPCFILVSLLCGNRVV